METTQPTKLDGQQQLAAQLRPEDSLFFCTSFSNHGIQTKLVPWSEVQWKIEVGAKLAAILEKLRERFSKSQNVCLCQAWVGADGCEAATPNNLEVTLWADPRLAIVLDPLLQDLRIKSCQGPVYFRNSMPGKVWRSGAVQIVQNLRILPLSLHPRSQLSDAALARLAEALYIPIYDLSHPNRGQICVLEVLLSHRTTEAMLVADVISFIGSMLTALHLSLANPVQQPVRRSVLSGRRPRAPDSEDEAAADGEGAGPSGRPHEQELQGQHQAAADADGAPGQQESRHPRESSPGRSPGGGEASVYVAAVSTGPVPHDGLGGPSCDSTAATGGGDGAGTSVANSDPVRGEVHIRGDPASTGAAIAMWGEGAPEAAAAETAAVVAATAAATAAAALALERAEALGPAAPPAAVVRCFRGIRGGEVSPRSEQLALPANPGHEHPSRVDLDAASAAASGAAVGASAMGHGVGPGVSGGGGACPRGRVPVPRKVRKVLHGPMQRTKSVASVAALSQGAADSEDESGGGRGGGSGSTHDRGSGQPGAPQPGATGSAEDQQV